MRGTGAIFRREYTSLFDSAVAPVTALLFVVACQGLFFFVGYAVGDLRLPPLWTGGIASLRALFAWLPLLFCVLVPALTMGGWAEERRSGTEELLLTQPIRPLGAVLGKFLAAWALLATLLVVVVVPVAIVVANLGPLDWAATAGGLLGAILYGGGCVALGLWISSLSGDQLIAFLVAAVLLGGLWSLGLLVRVLPPEIAELVHYFNPSTHFLESSALGVFDLRDLVYYASLIGAGLFLNVLAVEGRRWRGAS